MTHFGGIIGHLAVFEFHAVFLVGLLGSLSFLLREAQDMTFDYGLQPLGFRFSETTSLYGIKKPFSEVCEDHSSDLALNSNCKDMEDNCLVALHAIRQLVKITFPLG